MSSFRPAQHQRVTAISINGRQITVNLRRHHWSKQLKLTVQTGRRVLLTMPMHVPWQQAEVFLQRSRVWLKQQLALQQDTSLDNCSPPNRAQYQAARRQIEERLHMWAPRIGAQWQRVRIGNQRSRWGSCSARGTLSFNWRLVKLPAKLFDYVIVHELCHLKHLNHSPAFWQLVARHIPDYRQRRQQLRKLATGRVAT